jgi:hypothetical protein
MLSDSVGEKKTGLVLDVYPSTKLNSNATINLYVPDVSFDSGYLNCTDLF